MPVAGSVTVVTVGRRPRRSSRRRGGSESDFRAGPAAMATTAAAMASEAARAARAPGQPA